MRLWVALRTATPPSISINRWGKIRAQVDDGTFDVDLSVTDLRLYGRDQTTPRANVIADVQRRIHGGVRVILSVGLARAFQVQRRHGASTLAASEQSLPRR